MDSFKAEQQSIWNDLSSPWDKWHPVFEAGAEPVTRLLLDTGAVRPGATVLDVASGTGEVSVAAAERVGPRGRVVGVDIAADMVAVAQRRGAGYSQLTFSQGDAEQLDLPQASFDTVLSRWGLMFLPDRPRGLRGLCGLLRPGGRLAGSSWSVPPRAAVISTAFGVIGSRLQLPAPPPGTPGPFSMTDPAVVVDEFTAAGFTGAQADEVQLTFRFDSVDDFVAFSRDLLPPRMRQLVGDRMDDAERESLWTAVGERVSDFVDTQGAVDVPSTAICFHATKPE
ncbi:class I SAM-dependent methyltransferase [Micromonospora tarensis]|uniref:Methyltransferase domain-containing protein n=1 Tax=Micromonospora tarensis TaxID=2806100 RepID=A0ABS1YG70_9ACTN|nr:methyltransferase domain-containing protein [Micromonospora tarensis]MBM0276224.1 methyltransferase domain-containing protein [Micromonospora tarensis]